VTDVSRREQQQALLRDEHEGEGLSVGPLPREVTMFRTRDPRLDVLAGQAVLEGTTERDRRQICRLTTEVRLPAETVLCRQGAAAQEAFLLLEGEVTVWRDDTLVARVGPGELLGEIALLDGQLRSATAIAAEPVVALAVSADEFHQILAVSPVIEANARALSARRAVQVGLRQAA
jgi:CRP/FNR family cyclic AMP-dependent transcriptional regulator